LSHFRRGSHEDAARAAYRSVQANPAHSITHVQVTAARAKLARLEEAKAAAARVLELQPTFRYARQFLGVNCAPELAAPQPDTLRVYIGVYPRTPAKVNRGATHAGNSFE
jgi:hypothetical protein